MERCDEKKIVDDAIPIGLMSHACRFHVQYRTVGSTVVFVKLIAKMRGKLQLFTTYLSVNISYHRMWYATLIVK